MVYLGHIGQFCLGEIRVSVDLVTGCKSGGGSHHGGYSHQ